MKEKDLMFLAIGAIAVYLIMKNKTTGTGRGVKTTIKKRPIGCGTHDYFRIVEKSY